MSQGSDGSFVKKSSNGGQLEDAKHHLSEEYFEFAAV
jgi:hypothetical protein